MLTIDLETRSDKDITKCGVYPYAESGAFEILLFSYAADDDSEIKTIDIAGGEQIPRETFCSMPCGISPNTASQLMCMMRLFWSAAGGHIG